MELATFFPEARAFLNELASNNSREWFNARRDRYERVLRQPAEAFCERAGRELEALVGTPMRPRVFRIHRDVRFSRDKTPYNTHLHIGFSTAGEVERRLCGGFFFGIEPHCLVIGAGTLAFPDDVLAAYRERIAHGPEGDRLAALLKELADAGFRWEEAELKRIPQGCDPLHPHAGLLRRKSLAVFIDLPPEQATGDPVEIFLTQAGRLLPFHVWISGLRSFLA
ncbi:MAG: DUF2461 domain-containing protein [Magnetococcales bacterium]|nr:DUF2461 domain-containing protein [Magnetococcales bacterium]